MQAMQVNLRGRSVKIEDVSWESITDRMDPSIAVPILFKDHITAEQNNAVTPNHQGSLYGIGLGFDEGDESQGLFFINTASQGETRVTTYQEIAPLKVTFQIPELVERNIPP